MPKLMVTAVGFSSRTWVWNRPAPPLAVSPPMPALRNVKFQSGNRVVRYSSMYGRVLVLLGDAVAEEDDAVALLEEERLVVGEHGSNDEDKQTQRQEAFHEAPHKAGR